MSKSQSALKQKSASAIPTGLFTGLSVGSLHLPNRIVMSPMTRRCAPEGLVGDDVAAYYRRRAAADVGLIVTEGVWVNHPSASNDENVPRFYGEDALAAWANVVREVHEAGGHIIPQLWSVGLNVSMSADGSTRDPLKPNLLGPSGIAGGAGVSPIKLTEPMSPQDADALIEAFAEAAAAAYRIGFDGAALHGAHGYLIDQFFWEKTNVRTDRFGGNQANRLAFARDILQEIRRRTAPDYPIFFRFSQWKLHDYGAKLAYSPQELEQLLQPLAEAGVDVFDCSQRRFWEAEFEGSDLNLAGWTKKLTGKPTMTVGSVGLDQELMASLKGEVSRPASLDRLMEMFDRGDFDLVAVGRALLVDPQWASKVKRGAFDETLPFSREAMKVLF